MLVCFLACVKAGRGYCPIDRSVPQTRVEMILQALPARPCADDGGDARRMPDTKQCTDASEEIRKLAGAEKVIRTFRRPTWVTGGDTWYIIFTSGSTGTPKGVQISADCLSSLPGLVGRAWYLHAEEKEGQVFLNQAPFSFDLSVMDLYTSLASGGTLYCLEKTVQSDYRQLMQSLGSSHSARRVGIHAVLCGGVSLGEKLLPKSCFRSCRYFCFAVRRLAIVPYKSFMERFPKAAVDKYIRPNRIDRGSHGCDW